MKITFDKSNKILIGMIGSTLTVAVLSVCIATPAYADREGGRESGRHEGVQRHQKIQRASIFHGDIRHFDEHDFGIWRGGAWQQTRHNGRLGWWWVVGGLWYLYPQPVYPYPDPYAPPVVVTQSAPAVVNQPVAVAPAAASNSWYYCASTQGYYPYTASCPEGWETVPATPPTNSSTPPVR